MGVLQCIEIDGVGGRVEHPRSQFEERRRRVVGFFFGGGVFDVFVCLFVCFCFFERLDVQKILRLKKSFLRRDVHR